MSEMLPLLTEYIDEQHAMPSQPAGKNEPGRRYGGLRCRAATIRFDVAE